MIWRKGEAIEHGRTVPASALVAPARGDVHVTSDSRISVDPPCPSDTSLSVKHTELIKAQFLLQATSQRNARFSGAHDDDRIVSVGIFVVSIDDVNSIREICHE